ncbi:MAG: methionine--tRNA ligase [Bacillota bacterium]|nr:methionine--tRNA ligase [Bacillota bacterium]
MARTSAGSGAPGAQQGAGGRSFYVTTPIYYPSGRLHIGHAYTTVAADFIARYKRLCGFDTRFLTGTDEHGIKMQRAAAKAGLSPQAFADRAYAEIADLWRTLEISYDDFIRTTEPRHQRSVQTIFERVRERGDIYKGVYEGWYCADCESFFLARQLVDGKCPDCGRQVELLAEEAYFFRLSNYADRLLRHIDEHPEFIQPPSRRNEMISFVRSGLEDLCVSRTSFNWGIPVPGDPKHVIYVWFDALSNYITALGYGSDDELFDRYWPADVHLMGKEIVRFHSVIWPIILMALDLPLPKQVFGHGWLVLGGEKISKSRGNVIDPQVLVQKYGLDAVRYFLLREVPFVADGNYSEDALVRRTNTDLANDLGNLLQRTLAMVERFAAGRVPEPESLDDPARPLAAAANDALSAYEQHLDRLELANALGAVLGLVNRANKYIEEQSPWDLAKNPAGAVRLRNVLYDLLETLRVSAVLLAPALTRAPGEILRQIGWDGDLSELRLPQAARFGQLQPGRPISRGGPLFPRIETEDQTNGEGPAAEKTAGQQTPRITIDEFRRLDLRIARVVAADRVAGADRLLRLRVQLGEGERQIVAGVAAHYRPEDMVGKDIVVVANLEPAKIRGLASDGMLLAATGGGKLVLIAPEAPVPPGARVS